MLLGAPAAAGLASLAMIATLLWVDGPQADLGKTEDDVVRQAPRSPKPAIGKPTRTTSKTTIGRPRARRSVAAGEPVDASPLRGHGVVAPASPDPTPSNLVGFAQALTQPRHEDRRRRVPTTDRPEAFGHTLQPGEHFRFDVSFAGNPVGLAEAKIVGVESDPRGGPPAGAPLLKLEGHARTSGILSLLSTVTDDAESWIDARTGAPVRSSNTIHYGGWTNKKYRHRVTQTLHAGRGQIRMVDTKDDKSRRRVRQVPIDTFDPLSAMAWVRSLRLEPGEERKAHAMDGTALLRVEIVGRKRTDPDPYPTIATALGITSEKLDVIDGTVTRVDKYDRAIPGRRVYKLRAWLSADERRIPLVLESDMWVGSIRLVLSHYHPPR